MPFHLKRVQQHFRVILSQSDPFVRVPGPDCPLIRTPDHLELTSMRAFHPTHVQIPLLRADVTPTRDLSLTPFSGLGP
jgi:hypothetical protein